MAGWRSALAKTGSRLAGAVRTLFSGTGRLAAEDLGSLEEVLLQADIPAGLAMEWIEELEEAGGTSRETGLANLRSMMIERMDEHEPFDWPGGRMPTGILIVGINGSGKTTTCAKLALRAGQAGRRPLLAATDTFRAAGADQLKLWADRVGCDIVAGRMGADAAAVAYDAMQAARSRNRDTLIVDTAGRMHTRKPLMQELGKIRRAMGKIDPEAPHETWIVLDATLGQNAVSQARVFNDITPLTGAVVTKLDGSSRGGALFAVTRELGIPIRFVGLGEQAEDLRPFDREAYIDGLLGAGDEGAGAP